MPKVYTRMSQRKYAEFLGISNEYVSQAVKAGRIKAGWDSERKKIIVELANKEFGFQYREDIERDAINESDYVDEDGETENLDTTGDIEKPLGRNTTLQEAARRKLVLEANLLLKKNRLAELELMEREGVLVLKDEVYKQLFAFGQQLRIACLAVPDRTIDNVLAAKNRAEAHNILTTAIHGILSSLTSKDFDFKPRQ